MDIYRLEQDCCFIEQVGSTLDTPERYFTANSQIEAGVGSRASDLTCQCRRTFILGTHRNDRQTILYRHGC